MVKPIVRRQREERLYDRITNKQGVVMTIIEYRNSKDIDVEFEDGYILKNVRYDHFKDRSLKSLLSKSVNGVGFIGVGEYKCSINSKITREYNAWEHMIKRCVDEKFKSKNATYVDCSISEEFLNFQEFARFYTENKWTDEVNLIPDKDIKIKGNKLYSKETVLLVDARINSLFTQRTNDRGKYLIGVTKKHGKFYARMSDGKGDMVFIGSYDNEMEAFYAYKREKEKFIKQVADEYRAKYPSFPTKIYDAMCAWEVDVND